MKRKLLFIITIILAFFLISCVPAKEEPKNNPPIAYAGKDQYCYCGDTFILSATGSEDPDGDSLNYKWTIGGKVYTGKELAISFDSQGVYTVYLEVSDGIDTDTDAVKITIEPKEEATEEGEDKEETAAWQAKCTKVIDGDTIELETGEMIRYIGINCPESDEEYGDIATSVNSDLVLGKIVTLEKDVSETDKYGRILAYVYVGDIFVNAYLVENGYAQVDTYPPDVKYADHFLELQRKAVGEGKGFWAEAKEEIEEESQEEQTQQEEQQQEEQQEQQQVTYGINVVSLASPISRGSQASITINTAPNVLCTITVYYKSGPSTAQGLEPKNSDSNGNCTWSWKVGTRTTPGNWKIVLTANGVGQTETTFTVTE